MSDISEKIESRALIYDGKVIKIERVDVELPNGKPAMREVARHVGASAIVALDAEGRIALVRQYRTPVERELMEIPAGKLESKGEDRLLAAKRELREETGLTAKSWTKLADIVTTPGFCDELISIYLARDLSDGEADPDDDEFLRVSRLPLQEVARRIMAGEITDAKTICGVMLAREALSREGA